MTIAAIIHEQCPQHGECMLEHEHRISDVRRDIHTVKDAMAGMRKDLDNTEIIIYGNAQIVGLAESMRKNTEAITDIHGLVKAATKASWFVAYSCVGGLGLIIIRYIWLAAGDHLVTIGKAILGV